MPRRERRERYRPKGTPYPAPPAPKVWVGDGALGLWTALGEVWSEAGVRPQRCWNHKIVNVLDKLPRRLERAAKLILCTIPYAETRAEAERLRERFAARFGAEHPDAVAWLEKEWDAFTTFYDFPTGH